MEDYLLLLRLACINSTCEKCPLSSNGSNTGCPFHGLPYEWDMAQIHGALLKIEGESK